MEFRTLKYFLTVAREENITRAAALLHLTQPTLSRQLMQLEEELGVKLFRRSQHHIVLTEAGDAAAPPGSGDRRAGGEDGPGAPTGGGGHRPDLHRKRRPAEHDVSGKAPGCLHRQHPRVQYEIYSGDSDGIKERIEQGLLDMGLLLEPVDHQPLPDPPAARPGILGRPGAGGFAPGPAGGGDAGELADSPLILTTRELMRREMIRWFGPYADRIQVAASGNLPYNQTQLAREGLGIYLVIRLDCCL